jgi:hypothetical protein
LIARGFTLQRYPQVTLLKSPMAMTWKPRDRLAEIASMGSLNEARRLAVSAESLDSSCTIIADSDCLIVSTRVILTRWSTASPLIFRRKSPTLKPAKAMRTHSRIHRTIDPSPASVGSQTTSSANPGTRDFEPHATPLTEGYRRKIRAGYEAALGGGREPASASPA